MKFSIITVCLNSIRTIEETIKSVLEQKKYNIDLEYIIIDGGSTDGTLEIIKRYESVISYWVSEPDKGIYDAMNKGIKIAMGDVIAFLNSDDIYEKRALVHAKDAFYNGNVKAIFGNLTLVNSENEVVGAFEHGGYNRKRGTILPFPTVFIRKSIYDEYGGYDASLKIAADYDFTSKLEMAGVRFYYVNRDIARFRLGGVSSSKAHRWRCMMETRHVMLDREKELASLPYELQRLFVDFSQLIKLKRKTSLESFFLDRKEKYKFLYGWKFLKNKGKKYFIIWGCGERGEKSIQWVEKDNIDSFIDISQDKIGTVVCGKEVHGYSPHEVKNSFVIITPLGHEYEIQCLLEKDGFREGEDFLFFEKYKSTVIKAYIDAMGLGRLLKVNG